MIDVHVTPKQAGQLEVAWFLCAYPGVRRLSGDAAHYWRESQRHILGFVPNDDFRVVVDAPSPCRGTQS